MWAAINVRLHFVFRLYLRPSPEILLPLSTLHRTMSEFLQRYKRSEYLKNGCRECKRRKIKCDEFVNPPKEAFAVINHQGRSLCWNCTRLKKPCEYPRKGERVARVSRKQMLESERNSPGHSSSSHSTSNSPYDTITSRNVSSLASGSLLGQDDAKATAPMYLMPNGLADGANAMVGTSLPYQNYEMSPQSMQNAYTQPRKAAENTQYKSSALLSTVPLMSYALYPPADSEPTFGIPTTLPEQAPSLKASDIPNRGHLSFGSNVLHSSSVDFHSLQSLPKHDFNPMFQNAGPAYGALPANQNPRQLHEDSVSSMLSSLTANHMNVGGSSVFEPSDLAVLASDLNNIVSDMIFEMNGSGKNPVPNGNMVFRDSPTGFSDQLSPMTKPKEAGNNSIPRNVGPGMLLLSRPKEQQYLEEFYHGFASYILPFQAYDVHLKVDFNPVRDILLSCAAKEPVLLAAILSQSARTCYTRSNAPQDEDASYQYLLKCLKILGPALGQASSKDEDELISSIEGILLTVLLLTSANAANSKQDWRPHLKGAKDLLLKKAKYYRRSNSKIIIFCKFWFASFEILAGLSLKLGGTLKEHEEMNLLLSFDSSYELQVLKELGLVLDNGFSLLSGFHNDLTPTFRDLIKLLNKARMEPKQKLDETPEYIRLLSSVEWYSNCEFVNSQCFMFPTNFPSGMIPPGLLLEYVPDRSNPRVISWMDLSHQLYVTAAKVSILSELLGLNYNCPQIQALAQHFFKIFSQLAQVLGSKDYPNLNFLMVQWPLQVYGMILVGDEDRRIVTSLYKYADNIGAGSAGHTIKRLERIWHNRDAGLSIIEEDDVDIVSY